jgi:hypothetical protein
VIPPQRTAAPFDPPLESRNLAIVHAAMFDAVNSITREFQHYAVDLQPREKASPEAAAAAAAHRTLVRLYPARQAALDAAYAASLASVTDGPARANGIRVGEAVASEILASRAPTATRKRSRILRGRRCSSRLPFRTTSRATRPMRARPRKCSATCSAGIRASS